MANDIKKRVLKGSNDKLTIINRVQNYIITLDQLKKEELVFQNQKFSLPSLREPKDDPFDFFMDLLGVLKGKKDGVDKVLNEIIGGIDNINLALKSGLKKVILKSFFCDNDFIVLPQYTTNGSTDIKFSIPNIDYFFLLKTSPLDDVSGAYEVSGGLNRFIYDTLNGSAGTTSWEGLLTDVSFNQSTQELSFKINSKYANQPVSVFVNDYVDSLTILDNQFFKALFSVSQKPNKELQKRLKFLNKLINDIKNACAPTLDEVGNDESVNEAILNDLIKNKGKSLYETLNDSINKYNEFDTLANDFSNKINQILCQPLETPLNNQTILDGYDRLNNEINGLENYINNIESILNNSYQENQNNPGNGISTGGNPIDDSFGSLPTLDIDFKLGIIAQIPNNMGRLLLSPKVIMLFAILTQLQGSSQWGEGFESFLSKYVKSLFDMIKEIIKQVYEKIYQIIKDEILLIVRGLVIKILKEKLRGRLKIILSLLSLFDKFRGLDLNVDLSNCRSIIDGLLKITSLSDALK